MPSIRNVPESPTDQDTVNTLLSSSTSISLQSFSSTPISKSEVILIAIAAFFTLVAAAAILRVYIFPSTSDSCPQVAAKGPGARHLNAFRKYMIPSLIHEKLSAGPASRQDSPEGLRHNPEPRLVDALHPTSPLPRSNTNSDDESATLSVRAGFTCVWRRSQRNRTGSQSSAATKTTTTTTTMSDSLYADSIPRSSLTSMTSALENSDSEADLDGIIGTEEEGVVYEVKRAQTQSMEVKRGVLVSWRFSETNTRQKDSLPPPPMVIVSHSEEPADASKANPATKDTNFTSNGFLHPQSTPSLYSLASSESSTSSASFDLDEFPLPPKLLTSSSLSSNFLTVPENNDMVSVKGDPSKTKRSTVDLDHVLMLYV